MEKAKSLKVREKGDHAVQGQSQPKQTLKQDKKKSRRKKQTNKPTRRFCQFMKIINQGEKHSQDNKTNILSVIPLSLNFFKVGPTSKMEAASK